MTSTQEYQAPYPGSKQMPRWTTGELINAPLFTWRNWLAMIGPGLVMGASAIGGGEWLAGPAVTAKFGGAMLWVATVSIVVQVIYNIEISRYTLYCGEPIFNGKFRTLPGPYFWLLIYILLDWGSFAPYLAVNASVSLNTMFVTDFKPSEVASHWWLHKWVSTGIYTACVIPLLLGGKIYNSLKWLMSFKLVVVLGFLLVVGLLFSRPSTWWEIVSGFFKFGTVPVVLGEDLNGNGQLDPGEDFDHDGNLDVVEPRVLKEDNTTASFTDLDGDGKWDGTNAVNIVQYWFRQGKTPEIDYTLIAMIAGLAAIAGNGGLTNTPISNFTRDQGWGMGHHVGAIPSLVGGHGIELSHSGCVFDVNQESMPRWKRWYRHVMRDQVCVWMMACLIGVGLPSILSVEFLPRGTEGDDWKISSMTSGGVENRVTKPIDGVLANAPVFKDTLTGPSWGWRFKMGTLFCGFLVLVTSMVSTIDGFVRRWVDVIWSASPQLRQLETRMIRYVYFTVLVLYCMGGYTIMWVTEKPAFVFKLATTGYNFAFAFSCWHTIVVNSVLLPKQLRPRLWIQLALLIGGCYFVFLGTMGLLKLLGKV
ncbi:MAG: hypothetical protein FJ295_20475 [Planctomycetes bacterium]|nr:hypothetical protein [Planctomycetota bacterium]